MNTGGSSLRLDLGIHAIVLVLQVVVISLGGIFQAGSLPPLVLPFFLILSALTLIRIHEYAGGERWLLVPAGVAVLIYAVCLLSEMRTLLWGFSYPRNFPVITRVVWVQVALLLMHPGVYRVVMLVAVSAGRWLVDHGYTRWKAPFLIAAAIGVLWMLRNRNVSSDGYDWLQYSLVPEQWLLYLREPLGTLILRMVSWSGQKLLHWDPYTSISMLTIVCGIGTTILLYHVIAWVVPERYRWVGLVAVVANGGYLQVFAGNIEIYALLQLGLAVFLFCSMKYVRGQWPAWVPGLAFGVLFCVHLSAGWWIPLFLGLPLVKLYSGQGLRFPLWESVSQVATAGMVVLGFGVFLLMKGYDSNPEAMVSHFFSDQVMMVGTDRAMFHATETYLEARYYIDLLNLYVTLVPVAFLLVPLLLISVPRLSPLRAVDGWWMGVAFLYLVYSLVWNPDRPLTSDWDLFSGLTIPLAVVLVALVARIHRDEDQIQYALYQGCVFAGSFVLMQVLRNHFKVTDWPLFL